MKKRCTPENNAISIKTPVECPTIVTETSTCVNPILYIIDEAIIASTENNTTLLTELLLLLEIDIPPNNTSTKAVGKSKIYLKLSPSPI